MVELYRWIIDYDACHRSFLSICPEFLASTLKFNKLGEPNNLLEMKLDLVIVDDSKLWLSLAKRMAQHHPLVGRIETFSDSFDAWVYLQLTRPDLVMTDIEMPGMNGLSFLEMFGDKLPIISSSTKDGYALHAKELGCIDFLQKPFSKELFDKAINQAHQKCCARKRTRRRAKFSSDIW